VNGTVHPAASPGGTAEPAVLIVSEVHGERIALGALVEDLGFRAILAAGMEEAWAVGAADPGIQVLLTELRSPSVDGILLAARLLAPRRSVRVVFMTALDGTEVEHLLRVRLAVLHKPVTLASLASALRSAIADS
jgi:DNA-binding NtrC family response regulator